jgi:hypothetical protein
VTSSFSDALRAVNSLKAEGVVEDYAIAGAMAILFWTEPVPTYDLDVLVFLPGSTGSLVSLEGIYNWARRNGHPTDAEHVIVAGVPTQFLPAPSKLADEAIRTAAEMDYDGVRVRVVRPEYLIALYLEPSARTPKRQARAAMLLEWPRLNKAELDAILKRHGLTV